MPTYIHKVPLATTGETSNEGAVIRAVSMLQLSEYMAVTYDRVIFCTKQILKPTPMKLNT